MALTELDIDHSSGVSFAEGRSAVIVAVAIYMLADCRVACGG